MEISKKEKYVLIALTVIVGLFIYFMPTLDSIIRNKVNNPTSKSDTTKEVVEEEQKEVVIPTKFICNKNIATDTQNLDEQLIFNFDSTGNLNSIELFKTIIYANEELFNERETLVTDLLFLNQTISIDENSYMLTINGVADLDSINQFNTNYPTNYEDLKEYLSENKYTCASE
ncbi:MAG: hypothetical protein ACK5HP_01235 [Bacilli bacterium]